MSRPDCKIWLASFPRSGNTFVRNILFDVFGVESGTFNIDDGVLLEENYLGFPVIKTHMLPSQLVPADPDIKAVYLVRDGRDAMVSIAHHRKDIVSPGSDFIQNMEAAIFAEKGTFFGGWSRNVTEWIDRADYIIRYEDLIADPAKCAERIRLLMDLPEADYNNIPQFQALKFGIPRYGAGRDRSMTEQEKRSLAALNFRKGKVGSWKEEMPDDLHDLFWSIHGETMLRLGYGYDGSVSQLSDADFDWDLIAKTDYPPRETEQRERINVVVEAGKLASPVNDGVKRYQLMLLKELLHVHRNPSSQWHFDLFIDGSVYPISDMEDMIFDRFRADGSGQAGESIASALRVSWITGFQQFLLKVVPSGLKRTLVQKRILIFHKAFDLFWVVVHKTLHLFRQILRFIRKGAVRAVILVSGGSKVRLLQDDSRSCHLVHLPLQHHYGAFTRSKVPLVATLHDFTHRLFPDYHTPQNIRNAEKGWRFVQKNASALIAVSGSTAADARRFGGENSPVIEIIHEAVDRKTFHYRVNSDDRKMVCHKYGIPEGEPFFLTLSSIEPRKNLEGIIRAFFDLLASDSSIKLNLVVAGKQTWGAFHPHSLEGFDPGRVVFTGFVDDQDLPALYSEALCFCYISHYEGFGLPLLEAMNCGTPVIYGDNSSMPEVAGDAGLAANASDFRDIARQMGRIFYDEELRAGLRKAALKKAADFSMRKMAKQTLDLYKKSLKNA